MLGRRWSFATDDVPLMGFFPTMFHGLWALILVAIWIVFGKHRDCYDGTPFTVVLAGLFTTFTMFFIIGCWATYEGLKGGHPSPWRPHPPLCLMCMQIWSAGRSHIHIR